jgi:hypothetical protein
MRPYLKKALHKKRLVEWLKVKALSLSPRTAKKKKKKVCLGVAWWLMPVIPHTQEAEIRKIGS